MTDPDPSQPDLNDDWAAAFAEQDQGAPAAGADDDPWAAALAEQQGTVEPPAAPAPAANARSAGDDVFRPLAQGGAGTAQARDLEMILDIPVHLTVELGRARITIKQLLELAQGSVVELEGLAGEPMDILINGYLIAQGEVVVIEDRYGIRITEIITPSERVQKLNQR